MKKLTRSEMKKVKGGVDQEPQSCTNHSDCGSNVVVCNGDPYVVNEGRCINGTCRWGAVC